MISEYEERYPRPALLPKEPRLRARARWFEEAMLGVPPEQRRPRLEAAGAPLTPTTVMSSTPRPGVMATGMVDP